MYKQNLAIYSDLFLLPSEQESFGLVALEAMVHKVPVISTNVGGLPEVNKQNISGFLFPVGAVDAMAEQAISLLSNPQEHLKMKEQALMRATESDIFNIIPQYEAVYQSVLIDA